MIWGALHGLYLILEIQLRNLWNALPARLRSLPPTWAIHAVQRIIVLALVCFAWIFFRAASVDSAVLIGTKLLGGLFDGAAWIKLLRELSVNYDLLTTFAAILIMEVVHYYQERGSVRSMLATKPLVMRWALYVGIMVCILLFGRIYLVSTTFIYFQF